MCSFLSVLILKNGDIRHHPMLDSHSDLVTYFKLPDTDHFIRHFAKAELTPGDWLDVATWTWRVDEETIPAWLTEQMVRDAAAATRAIASKMILRTGQHRFIVDGCWILGGNVTVSDIRGGRIMRVQDSATVQNVRGSATVRDVGDSATVRDVGDSATVQNVGDSATVQNVWGYATVRDVRDSATVRDVRDSVCLDASARASLEKN